jgi:UDP-N-acetylmuramyl pentapeptide phosphotransferase/UDP-N-acetylglucosamine-1-phosphate transferase
MSVNMNKRTMDALGETNLSAAKVMATPNAPIRFWIITMMLVLIGLATLKLR